MFKRVNCAIFRCVSISMSLLISQFLIKIAQCQKLCSVLCSVPFSDCSWHGHQGKNFFFVFIEWVFIGPLPSNGCPSIIENVTPGLCLPSRYLAMVICVTIL
jgi:hypothetical protein